MVSFLTFTSLSSTNRRRAARRPNSKRRTISLWLWKASFCTTCRLSGEALAAFQVIRCWPGCPCHIFVHSMVDYILIKTLVQKQKHQIMYSLKHGVLSIIDMRLFVFGSTLVVYLRSMHFWLCANPHKIDCERRHAKIIEKSQCCSLAWPGLASCDLQANNYRLVG